VERFLSTGPESDDDEVNANSDVNAAAERQANEVEKALLELQMVHQQEQGAVNSPGHHPHHSAGGKGPEQAATEDQTDNVSAANGAVAVPPPPPPPQLSMSSSSSSLSSLAIESSTILSAASVDVDNNEVANGDLASLAAPKVPTCIKRLHSIAVIFSFLAQFHCVVPIILVLSLFLVSHCPPDSFPLTI
jgi:hypothetical protein